MSKTIQFEMVFGCAMDGFAMTPQEIEYLEGCRPADFYDTKDQAGTPPNQQFTLTVSDEDHKGILTSEHGKQKIDDIFQSAAALSFSAFAGSEGVEIFQFTLMYSDSTAQIVGYACGTKPCFRGFMPLRGRVLDS